MRFGLAFALVALSMSAQLAAKEVDILVPPGVLTQPVEKLIGTIGTSSVRALSISPANKTPAVIIADLAATPVERHACLLQEIAAALPNQQYIPVYASTGTMRNLFYPVDMADGQQLGLLSRLPTLSTLCKESLSHQETPRLLGATLMTHELFRALAHRYASQGPLRVFWLSTDFRAYDWRTPEQRPGLRGLTVFNEYPAFPEFHARPLSEAQITLFPLLIDPSHRKESGGRFHGDVRQYDARQYLAHQTGGLSLASVTEPGEALRRLMEESLKYQVVQVEMPDSVPLLSKSTPTHLQLGSFDRIFVTDLPDKAPELKTAGILVTRYTMDLAVSGKCPEMPGEGTKLRLHLPEHIVKSPPSILQVHIEALRPKERSLRQRLLLKRPGLMCVALQDGNPGTKHLVTVHDEQAHWTAIYIGELN